MSQNRSSAVMARRSEPLASIDYFPTPPWATRALCEWLKERTSVHMMSVWEPACGEGHMARPLAEFFGSVKATDILDYGFGSGGIDFIGLPSAQDARVDWIITNPPFTLAEEFAHRAFDVVREGVAFILRSSFLEGTGRYDRLFSKRPPADILQFTERVPMVRGRLDKDASSATAYSWIIWRNGATPPLTRFHWVPSCRKRLERAEDYAVLNAAGASA
jgi:hypothetical protein